MLEPFREVGANFSLQVSSRTQFTKTNKKKVIPENQCEKHSVFLVCSKGFFFFVFFFFLVRAMTGNAKITHCRTGNGTLSTKHRTLKAT